MNEEMNNGGSVEKTPFYKKNWFVILLIIFIPPAGLVMMWVNKQFGKTARIVLTIVLAIYSVLWLSALFSPAPAKTTQPAPVTQSEAQPSASAAATAAPTPEPTPAVPTEYKSALKKAKTYSDTMHMSKQGLYEQLTSEYGEKFSAEAAQYAIDNLDADYNYNALQKAKSYQETMAMSPEAIRDQLTSEYGEKFTQEEADYAIANLSQKQKRPLPKRQEAMTQIPGVAEYYIPSKIIVPHYPGKNQLPGIFMPKILKIEGGHNNAK